MSRVFTTSLQRINTPASSVYNSMATWSVAAWIFIGSITAANSVLITKSLTTGLDFLLSSGNSRLLKATQPTSGTAASSISTATLPLSTWTHVAATFNTTGDGKIRIYINGVETAYSTQTAATGTVVDDSAGGFAFASDGSNPFHGDMAEVVVWNTSLTAAQVATLAASTTGVPGTLPATVGYWHLLGTASPEPDSSGNGNSGTLQNAPTLGPDSPGYSAPIVPNYWLTAGRRFVNKR